MGSFFGYGSLVNNATHAYVNTRPATVCGWRRQWVQSALRDASFLSVQHDPLSYIQGVVADVGQIGWEALDVRERAYNRRRLTEHELPGQTAKAVHIYQANPDFIAPKGGNRPILLSYLDCVVQGFLAQFEEDGVRDFFRSTSGWDTPVRDDRAAPIYPRSQTLTSEETLMVDFHLSAVGATIVPMNGTTG
ncbi:MAG: gamma-glutamylcyclotransferase [Rhodobacteraceae bacterium]|nr:gamma-glutamylcyclotransferase [Paracoccaceae bacterium]